MNIEDIVVGNKYLIDPDKAGINYSWMIGKELEVTEVGRALSLLKVKAFNEKVGEFTYTDISPWRILCEVKSSIMCIVDHYLRIQPGEVLHDGEYREEGAYYHIKGYRYSKKSFIEVNKDDPAIQKPAKKPVVEVDYNAKIDKLFVDFEKKLEKCGVGGLCAYRIVRKDGVKITTKDHIADVCHGRIVNLEGTAVAVFTDVTRKLLDENKKKYMHFILNDSHFSDIYIGRKDRKMLDERDKGIALDVNRGVNEVATAAILVRTVWEHPQDSEIWNYLVDNDVNPHVAQLFAFMGKGLSNSGSHHIFHNCAKLARMKEWCKNGGFIFPGKKYAIHKGGYQVSKSWIGINPPDFYDENPKDDKDTFYTWYDKCLKDNGLKPIEQWGEKVWKLDEEDILMCAKQFEKEL